MKIFVLLAGVKNIGESVRGVFSSLEKAQFAANKVPSSAITPWRQVTPLYFTNSKHEYLEIEEFTLNEVFSSAEDVSLDSLFNKETLPDGTGYSLDAEKENVEQDYYDDFQT